MRMLFVMAQVRTIVAKAARAPDRSRLFASWGNRFKSDERGNIAITFGLMLTLMLSFMGASVDMGRWLQARKTTMEAMDAGVLAGLKNYQQTSDPTEAAKVALITYTNNVTRRAPVVSDNVGFVMQQNLSQMIVTGNAIIATPFLKFATVPSLPLLKQNMKEHPIGKVAIGMNTGTTLEVSLMLDNTLSMDQSDGSGSTKFKTMKQAAKDLIDILVWDTQTDVTSKVALVPFSAAVNVGSDNAEAIRGVLASGVGTVPGSTSYKFTKRNTAGTATYKATPECVVERTGPEAYTDVAPSFAPMTPWYSNANGTCNMKSPIMPLTNDKNKLKDAIDNFTTSGNTAGQIGTAWAWYMLSSNFNYLWPSESQAAPYSDLKEFTAKGKPKLQKYAVLLTDGEYNTEYCNGVDTGLINCDANNGLGTIQAPKLCTAMKDKGIIVFTIGFKVAAGPKALLQGCASNKAYYYDATNGTQLRQAFQDIAGKLVPTYLSH